MLSTYDAQNLESSTETLKVVETQFEASRRLNSIHIARKKVCINGPFENIKTLRCPLSDLNPRILCRYKGSGCCLLARIFELVAFDRLNIIG